MDNSVSQNHSRKQTRLAYPGERLALADPFPGDAVEEMRSLEIEREHNVGAERWQRLRRGESRSEVMLPHPRVNERLVTEGLDEIEARCRGSRGNPWACHD